MPGAQQDRFRFNKRPSAHPTPTLSVLTLVPGIRAALLFFSLCPALNPCSRQHCRRKSRCPLVCCSFPPPGGDPHHFSEALAHPDVWLIRSRGISFLFFFVLRTGAAKIAQPSLDVRHLSVIGHVHRSGSFLILPPLPPKGPPPSLPHAPPPHLLLHWVGRTSISTRDHS